MRNDWTRSRVGFLMVTVVGFLLVLFWARELLIPFLVAILLAYVMAPPVVWCESRGVPRALSVLLVYLVTLTSLGAAGWFAVPRLYREAVELRRELPELGREVAQRWGPELERRLGGLVGGQKASELAVPGPAFVVESKQGGAFEVRLTGPIDIVADGPRRWQVRPRVNTTFEWSRWFEELTTNSLAYARENVSALLRVGKAVATSAVRGILLTFMMLICAGYLIYTRDRVIDFFRSLVPVVARPSFDRLLVRIDRSMSGVVRGQLAICVVNGVLSGIGFALFDLKYWPLLALIAGVFSVVPIFGALLSSVPAIVIALLQGVWPALWTLLWILGIHQLEANLLNPKIIGTMARMHPVLVIFALLLGERSFGLWGAVLALPALSLLQSVFFHVRHELLGDIPDSLRPPKTD